MTAEIQLDDPLPVAGIQRCAHKCRHGPGPGFEKRRGGTLNTIQSTLDRLYKKGLLRREKQGHAFHYQAAMDRQAFIGKLIEGIGEDYSADPGSTLIAAFSTFSEKLSDKQIEALEKLIEARREADAEQSDQ